MDSKQTLTSKLFTKENVISLLIVVATIYFGPLGLIFLILWRKDWWKKLWVKVATIGWATIYSVAFASVLANPPVSPHAELDVPTRVGATVAEETSGDNLEEDETEPEEKPEDEVSDEPEVAKEDQNEPADKKASHTSQEKPATPSRNNKAPTKPANNSTKQPTAPATKPVAPAQTTPRPSTPSASTSSPADTNATQGDPLPLKAICKDGTVSYQDDPYGKDYRGMCSKHQGIKTKLGRIK